MSQANRTCHVASRPTTGHRLHETGVDLKRVPPKSRSAARHDNCSSIAIAQQSLPCGSQGLRRPRFSFFRFTCQTARGRKYPSLQNARRAAEARPRLLVGDRSPLSVRSFEGAPSRRAAARHVWRYIGRDLAHCQPCLLQFFSSEQLPRFQPRGVLADPGGRDARGATTRVRRAETAGSRPQRHVPHCGHIFRLSYKAWGCAGTRSGLTPMTFNAAKSRDCLGLPGVDTGRSRLPVGSTRGDPSTLR